MELNCQNDYSRDLDDVTVTQTLFNTDDEYEFLAADYGLVNKTYETPDFRESGDRIVQTGFSVISENGSTIASVKFPSGMFGYVDDLFVTSAGNFLVCNLENQAGEAYIVTYKVDNGGGGINLVGAPVKVGMKVTPTATTRGTSVNVSMAPAEKGTRLSVIGADGRRVFGCNLESGATSATVETGRFSSGIYVVVLEDSKGTRENCKIIIR